MTDDVAEQLQALAQRVQSLEDERSIAALIARYGPLVDTGDPAVAELWCGDGVYDVDELLMSGATAVGDMVRSAPHQRFVRDGCAHFQGPVHIQVDGDRAQAVGYSLMLVHTEDGFRLRRVTANRWSLVRQHDGWRVTRRTSRLLDGREEARAVLRGERLTES